MPATPATLHDMETVARLAHAIWMEHYPAIIGMEQTRYMLQKMYAPQALQTQREQGHRFYLWHEHGEPVGFAAIDPTPGGHGFLAKFYLQATHRGQGIAPRFLAYLEERLREAGKPTVQLTVNRQNIGAINFYFKSGFKIIRCADFDIGNGYFMNDFVMEKPLMSPAASLGTT